MSTESALVSAIPSFGKRVKEVREAQDLSQEDIASKTGLDTGMISKIESQKTSPSLLNAEKIAYALGLKLPTFFLDDEAFNKALMESVKSHEIFLVKNKYGKFEVVEEKSQEKSKKIDELVSEITHNST